MIVNKKNISVDNNIDKVVKVGFYEFYYRGVLFIPGVKEGAASLKVFSKILEKEPIEKACNYLWGNFFITIKDNKKNTLWSFIDKNGVFDAFYDEDTISTSFLQLVNLKKYTYDSIDKEKVIEFLNLGFIMSEDTFIFNVKKVRYDEILTYDENNIKKIKKNNIFNLDQFNTKIKTNYFLEHFKRICISLGDMDINIDITGGSDSRLILSIIDHYKLNYSLSISGMPGNKDIKIAKKISKLLNKPLMITYHKVSQQTIEDEIIESFELLDGLFDALSLHRTIQHHKRKDKNSIVLSGGAGELYKDFFWLQDFPFYKKSKTNLKRLIKYRILSIKLSDKYLTEEFKFLNSRFLLTLENRLKQYLKDINTKTYDNIYYRLKVSHFAGRAISTFTNIIPIYMPLSELELVKYSYNLDRMKRFFNNFHREVISNLNPELSRLPTNHAYITTSNNLLFLLVDFIKFSFSYVGKFIRKILLFSFKEKKFQESPDNPDIYKIVRNTLIIEKSLEILKEYNILSSNLTIDDIANRDLGKILTLGLFFNKVKNN